MKTWRSEFKSHLADQWRIHVAYAKGTATVKRWQLIALQFAALMFVLVVLDRLGVPDWGVLAGLAVWFFR